MQIPVLIEPVAQNGYRARGIEPFAVSAKGATREEALAKLRAEIEKRLKNGAELVGLEVGGTSNDPWMEFAGMFKGDPWIDDWKRSIEEYRKQVDEDPNTL
jgi:predicted RNase H-like HicB family nuclease